MRLVNRSFMAEFIEADPPCFALGLVEVGDTRCAMVALRPEQAIPQHVTEGGFRFGHALLGAAGWEVIPFVLEFYGFAIFRALVNPSDPAARQVLSAMGLTAWRTSGPTWTASNDRRPARRNTGRRRPRLGDTRSRPAPS